MAQKMKLPIRNFYKAILDGSIKGLDKELEKTLTIRKEFLQEIYEISKEAELRHFGYAFSEGCYEMRNYINQKDKGLPVAPPFPAKYNEDNYDND